MILLRRAWLMLVAAGLGLLLAAELLLPGAPAQELAGAPVIPSAAPGSTGDDAAGRWAATILARPLFNTDRRPMQAAGTATVVTLPRLSAIIVTGGARRAIFSDGGDKPQIVGKGSGIAGYRVRSIAPDLVQLDGPDGLVTLHPQFGSDPPPPAAAVAAAPAPVVKPHGGSGYATKPVPLSNDPI